MPITLDMVCYPTQNVQANAAYTTLEPEEATWEHNWSWQVPDHDQNRRLGGIFLSLKQQENRKYEIELYIFGAINVNDEPSENLAALELTLQQMLIGMARERIRLLTDAGPWGAILLPPIHLRLG